MKERRDKNGVHLFDRRTGLNVLVEQPTTAGSWSAAPRYVSIALTNSCDLACAYCYAPKHRARLDRARLELWLAELDNHGCLGVGFGGGEPTLYPGFANLCRWAQRHTDLAVTFTTHGHHLDERLCSELDGAVHFLRISMDGVGETYERLRGRAFSALTDVIERVRVLAPFGINFVVNEDTIGQLDRAAEFASSVGAVELLLLPQEANAHLPGADESVRGRLSDWIRGATPAVRLAISERGAVDGLPVARPFAHDAPLDSHAHVDASGMLKASSYDALGIRLNNSIIAGLSELRVTYDGQP